MTLRWDSKRLAEVLDFKVKWTSRLDSDTITGSTWTVQSGLTKNSDSFSDTETTIWLSGGSANTTYKLQNTVTTSGGRTHEVEILLRTED